MPDRAEEEARDFRGLHFLNIALAAAGRKEGYLNEACEVAEQALATALRSRDTQLAEARERIRALEDAIEHVRAIIVDGSLTGFNCLSGDWAERLYASQGLTANLLGPERIRAARARTILSPATETEGEK